MSQQNRKTFLFKWMVELRNKTATGNLVLMPSGDYLQLLYLRTATQFYSSTHITF